MTAKKSEHALMNEIRCELSSGDTRLFRQQVGEGWVGSDTYCHRRPQPRTVTMTQGDVLIRQARRFVSGFDGWPDLGGFRSIIITPEMVGQRVAVYAQVEVKTATGRVKPTQRAFLDMTTLAGGLAGIARSVDDAKKVLDSLFPACSHDGAGVVPVTDGESE